MNKESISSIFRVSYGSYAYVYLFWNTLYVCNIMSNIKSHAATHNTEVGSTCIFIFILLHNRKVNKLYSSNLLSFEMPVLS